MTTDKIAEDPHKAQQDLLCEHCNNLHALRLAIEGLADEDDRRGLMFIHDQLRSGQEKIFELHEWLENAKDDGRGDPKVKAI